MSKVFWILGLSLISLSAFAAEGKIGSGGGDAVILPNDNVVLADPFVKIDESNGDEPREEVEIELSKELKGEVSQIIRATSGYLQNFLLPTMTPERRLEYLFVNRRNIFYVVKEIPNFPQCQERLHYSKLPDGSKVSQVACTIDDKTWIREDLFRQMNLREQALLIVHEGLRRLGQKLTNADLTDFTNGIRLVMELRNRQAGGDYSPLSQEESSQIKRFFKTALYVATTFHGRKLLDLVAMYEVTPHGGLIHKAVETCGHVSPTAVIGVASTVGTSNCKKVVIGDGAVLVNTNAAESAITEIGANAKIVNTEFFNDRSEMAGTNLYIGSGSELRNSSLGLNPNKWNSSFDISSEKYNRVYLGENAKVLNSQLPSEWTAIRRNASVRNVVLGNVDDNTAQLEIQNGAVLSGIKINRVTTQRSKFRFGNVIAGDDYRCAEFGEDKWYRANNYEMHSIDDVASNCKAGK